MQNSLSALLFGTSCCAKSLQEEEFHNSILHECGIQTLNTPAKAADLLIITGTINEKLAPHLINLYNKMPKPSYIILLGDCACNKGIFSNTTIKTIDIERFLPVDICLKGCPVKASNLINAIKELKDATQNKYIKKKNNVQNPPEDSTLENNTASKTVNEKESGELKA